MRRGQAGEKREERRGKARRGEERFKVRGVEEKTGIGENRRDMRRDGRHKKREGSRKCEGGEETEII